MSGPPPPPGRGLLQRQYTGLADTFRSHIEEAASGASQKISAVAATNANAPAAILQPIVAGTTDPGVVGKQNQDEFFVWQSPNDGQTLVMGVLDGHGRELGQMAARVAKDSFLRSLTSPEGLAGLHTDPQATLNAAFATAHSAIESAFRKWYEDCGWTVTKGHGPEGYLTRSKPGMIPQCVHGGTTATLVILLKGQRLIISNVGDSTALLCGIGEAGSLRPIQDWVPLIPVQRKDAPISTHASLVTQVPAEVAMSYMELSADHSPECPSEFARMHQFRPHAHLPHHPELLFVYDTLTASKTSCPPIFEVDHSSGSCNKTDRGSYYKNVRCEWASLVSTPPHAPFQDALAFTRSLGDLHLQMYGVTHTPEIWWMDIAVPGEDVAAGTASSSNGASADTAMGGTDSEGGREDASVASELASKLALDAGRARPGSALVPHALALVLCSDGVWDNWRFEDVAGFVLDKSRVERVGRGASAEEAVNDLMAANLDRARVNFGSSADNMTAVTLYLLPRA